MFRYLALAPDAADPTQVAVARMIREQLRARAGWSTVVNTPSLFIAVTGARPPANQAYPLAAGRGAVLGKLFRRQGAAMSAVPAAALARDTERLSSSQGQHLVDAHWGRYVAFLTLPNGRIGVLRDPSGALPCFRLRYAGVWIVFSWLEDVQALLPDGGSLAVCQTALRAHLALGAIGGPATVLEDVRPCLPGELTVLHPGEATRQPLWSATAFARAPLPLGPEEAAERLRDTVQQCVRLWAGAYERLVLRLSGGVDSSILANCLRPDATSTAVQCLHYYSEGMGPAPA